MGQFYTAQVCLRGHVIEDMCEDYPEAQRKFCEECGAPTTSKCVKCSGRIPGRQDYGHGLGGALKAAPAFCGECGEPHPWTIERLQAARELAEMEDQLGMAEKAQVKSDLQTITQDSPSAKVAATRLQRIWSRLSTTLQSAATEIATEAVKRIILGP